MVLADKKVDSFNDDKKWFNRINNVVDVPNLIQIQTASYDWLTGPGIKDLIDEISPIEDFSGGRFEVRLIDHEIREPELSEEECRIREISFQAPIYVTCLLYTSDAADE